MVSVRHWSVRHAGALERFYQVFERTLVALDPLWRRIGYERLEKPVAALEKVVKGFLFDCQMCGQCALSSTGMSCSMNCPKNLRNGPWAPERGKPACGSWQKSFHAKPGADQSPSRVSPADQSARARHRLNKTYPAHAQ